MARSSPRGASLSPVLEPRACRPAKLTRLEPSQSPRTPARPRRRPPPAPPTRPRPRPPPRAAPRSACGPRARPLPPPTTAHPHRHPHPYRRRASARAFRSPRPRRHRARARRARERARRAQKGARRARATSCGTLRWTPCCSRVRFISVPASRAPSLSRPALHLSARPPSFSSFRSQGPPYSSHPPGH